MHCLWQPDLAARLLMWFNACSVHRAPYDNIFTAEGISLRKQAEQLPNLDMDSAQDGQGLAAVADQCEVPLQSEVFIAVLAPEAEKLPLPDPQNILSS